MEEILIFLIQLFVEVLAQVIIELPFDFSLNLNEKTSVRTGAGWHFLYLTLGAAAGGLSVLIAPWLFYRTFALRLANLIVAPLAAGGFCFLLANWRRSRGVKTWPRTHLWTAFWFVLAFSAIRLGYATG